MEKGPEEPKSKLLQLQETAEAYRLAVDEAMNGPEHLRSTEAVAEELRDRYFIAKQELEDFERATK